MTDALSNSRAHTISRRVAKTITWRLIATAITAVLVYAFTGRLELAGAVAGAEVVAKMAAYFLHETAWYWSRKRSGPAVDTGGSHSSVGVPVHAE